MAVADYDWLRWLRLLAVVMAVADCGWLRWLRLVMTTPSTRYSITALQHCPQRVWLG